MRFCVCTAVGVLLCLVYGATCQRAVPHYLDAWDFQQQQTSAAAARTMGDDLDDLAVLDESARLIVV